MFAQLTVSFTMLHSWPSESLYHCPHTKQIHVVRKVTTIYGLCRGKYARAKDVTIIHSTTASHTLGHPCLVSLPFMNPNIPHLNFSFTCLLSIFTAYTCIGAYGHIKSNMYLLPQIICRR